MRMFRDKPFYMNKIFLNGEEFFTVRNSSRKSTSSHEIFNNVSEHEISVLIEGVGDEVFFLAATESGIVSVLFPDGTMWPSAAVTYDTINGLRYPKQIGITLREISS